MLIPKQYRIIIIYIVITFSPKNNGDLGVHEGLRQLYTNTAPLHGRELRILSFQFPCWNGQRKVMEPRVDGALELLTFPKSSMI